MSVEIEFDAFQDHQLRAIDAVVDLFTGQEASAGEFELELLSMPTDSDLDADFGSGNALTISDEDILANLLEIQARNEIPDEISGVNGDGLVSRDFSVEMETGTGKTYVFLRTIRELHQRYGLTKFVIVVPRIATREGAMANIRLLHRHFTALYGTTRADGWVYSSGQVTRLRHFGQASHLQVLIMNIDAFTKDTNIINQPNDKLSGYRPIDFIRATNPVVILDEPQELESDLRRAAIASLNPLVTLRYSATHRNLHHPVYRLSPVDAYDLGLVKRIEVASVRDDPDFNRPSITLEGFSSTRQTVKATVTMDVDRNGVVKRRKVKVDQTSDLYELSGHRPEYEGFTVEGIDAGRGVIEFGNGVSISEGEGFGTPKDALMEVQIRETVIEHLDKELDLARRTAAGEISETKVLSLFFIDRVANYAPDDGKIRQWFRSAYEEIAARPKYAALDLPPVDVVHGGYFAEERPGVAKDTRGESKADERIYELILRNKEQLLSPAEPLRFLFTHTALGEGWDNPNVFQICTLNELKSDVRKRQQIGRGLRLPVMADGARCHHEDVNTLVVVANESYDRFARELQHEIEEETGVTFAGRVRSRRERVSIEVKPALESDAQFLALWDAIRWKTTYRVAYDTEALITKAAAILHDAEEIRPITIHVEKAALLFGGYDDEGRAERIETQIVRSRRPEELTDHHPIPDLIGHLCSRLPLTRRSIARILRKSERLGDVGKNPQAFLDLAFRSIRFALDELLAAGIEYAKLDDGHYEMRLFTETEATSYADRIVEVDSARSISEQLVVDSNIERQFAEKLDSRTDDVVFFMKLPRWFEVETPLGAYRPDWAVTKLAEDGVERIHLVKETKGNFDPAKLRPTETLKIRYGGRHFDALGVPYSVATSIDDL